MRLFINNLTPEYPDPEDEAYWDFMADSLNMRRYDDEGTRPNSIDLTMITQQGTRKRTTQVVSFRAPTMANHPYWKSTATPHKPISSRNGWR